MAQESPPEAPRKTTTQPSKGGARGSAAGGARGGRGNAWKWAAGAAAATVLLGGGYLAWKNYAPSQQSGAQEVAYNEGDSVDSSAPYGAADLKGEGGATASAASADASNEPRTTASAKRSTSRAPAEEVVGVRPASYTTAEDDNEITVPGRRAIWTRKPSARRLSTLYPERALSAGREGEASVRCTVVRRGDLDCVKVSETPARAGFGNAALRVARLYRHGPRRADGSSADGSSVNLRVIFRMEDERRRG